MDKLVKIENPMETENSLIVFTDGSALNNGKQNARASYATVWPYHPELNFSSKLLETELHTNNRAEYKALIHAFGQANEIDPKADKTLIIYTDSMLLVNTLTLWMAGWKRKDWRKSDGNIIANLDLVKQLDAFQQQRKIVVRHVRAHTGKNTWEATYNDMVDKLARGALLSRHDII